MFSERSIGSRRYFVFSELEQIPGFLHFFTCKDSSSPQEDPGGYRGLLKELAIEPARLRALRQCHSNRVLLVPGEWPNGPADGLIVREEEHFAVIRTADCLPLLLVSEETRELACFHAGWRGTCAGIAAKGAARFLELTGVPAEKVKAFLGPCIRPCCYQVGPEVRRRFAEAGWPVEEIFREGCLDLEEANRRQLASLGIPLVARAGHCTCCRPELYHSYRRDRTDQRMWMLAGFRSRRAL